jgi:hypothetical protein
MSVNNETLDLHKPSDRADEAPSLEYRSVGHDSLSMFLSAIGGAILGVLLTLLILAILNGGTLNFAPSQSVAEMQATVSQVNQNLGILSQNVDVVATELTSVHGGLVAAQSLLTQVQTDQVSQQADVAAQIGQVNQAIATLDVTRERFDIFVSALGTALAELDAVAGPASQTTQP